jgi:hypothetical protein
VKHPATARRNDGEPYQTNGGDSLVLMDAFHCSDPACGCNQNPQTFRMAPKNHIGRTNQAARARFYYDPEFRAAVELVARTAINSVEEADRIHEAEDTGYTRYEDRHVFVLGDMIDLLGNLDAFLGKTPEICYGTVYPHQFQGHK